MEGGSLRWGRVGYIQDARIVEHLSSPLFPFRLTFISYSQGSDYPLSGGPRTMSISSRESIRGRSPQSMPHPQNGSFRFPPLPTSDPSAGTRQPFFVRYGPPLQSLSRRNPRIPDAFFCAPTRTLRFVHDKADRKGRHDSSPRERTMFFDGEWHARRYWGGGFHAIVSPPVEGCKRTRGAHGVWRVSGNKESESSTHGIPRIGERFFSSSTFVPV